MRQEFGQRRGQREAGFTLIELMITLAVIIVLIVAVGPLLSFYSERSLRSDLQNATETLMGRFDFARSLASNSNQAVEVVLDVNNNLQKIMVYQHTASNCQAPVVNPNPVPDVLFTSKSGTAEPTARFPLVTIVAVVPADLAGNGPGHGLCFRPDGRVTDAATGVPIVAPGGTSLAAGDAEITLKMYSDINAAAAISHNIFVSYNGLAHVEYQAPRAAH